MTIIRECAVISLAILVGGVCVSTSNAQAERTEGTVAVWGRYSVAPAAFVDIARVAGGPDYSLAVTRGGKVLFWGLANGNGAQVGLLPATLNSNIVDVAAGWFGVALRKDSTPVAWGYSPYVPGNQVSADAGLTNIVRIISGRLGDLWAIKEDRTAVALTSQLIPMCPMPNYSNVEDIAPMAPNSTCNVWGYGLVLFRDGRVESYGQWNGNTVMIPPDVQGSTAISAGEHTCMVLKTNGTVVCWSIYTGSTTTDAFGASIVPPTSATNVVAIAAGRLHYMALRSDGTVVTWGYSASEPGVIDTPAGLSNVVQISAGTRHCLALKSDGTVVAWGSPAAVGVLPGDRAVKVATTYSDIYLLKLDGTVGHMGGTAFPGGWTNVMDLDADPSGHLLALKSDGTVLTLGGITDVPVGLNGIAAVAAGGIDFMGGTVNVVLTTNHLVKAWGSGTPVTLPPDGRPADHALQDYPGIAAIDAAGANIVVLTTNGEVRTWTSGLLTPPANLAGVVAVAIGSEQALALRNDGTVVGWGTYYGSSALVIPAAWTKVIKIDAKSVACAGCIPINANLALQGDGTVLSMGGYFPPPPDLTGVFEISTGGYISAAIFSPPDPPAVTRVCPHSGDPGTVVRIDGAGFLFVTDVVFNGIPAAFTNDFNFVLYATVPAGATTGPIQVVSPYGTATVERHVVPNGLTPIETWRVWYFNSPENAGEAADLADPDGDGKPNLLEYYTNTDPLVADVIPSLLGRRVVLEGVHRYFDFVLRRNVLATDVTPHFEYTLDLHDSWQPFSGSIADAGAGPESGCQTDAGIKRVQAPDGADQFFLRYRLTRP